MKVCYKAAGKAMSVFLITSLPIGVEPRGVVLLAPFTSIGELLEDYHLFGLFPIMQPLQPLPIFQSRCALSCRLSQYILTLIRTTSQVARDAFQLFVVDHRAWYSVIDRFKVLNEVYRTLQHQF